MAQNEAQGKEPIKVSQKGLEAVIERVLVSRLPQLLEKVLGEQLGNLLEGNAPRQRTELDILQERKTFLLEELSKLDEQIETVQAGGSVSVLSEHADSLDFSSFLKEEKRHTQGKSSTYSVLADRIREQKREQLAGNQTNDIDSVLLRNVQTAGEQRPVRDTQADKVVKQRLAKAATTVVKPEDKLYLDMIVNAEGTTNHLAPVG